MRTRFIYKFLLIPFLTLIYGCGSFKPYYDKNYKDWKSHIPPDSSEIKYSVFLVGDAGQPSLIHEEPVISLLRKQLYEKIDTTFIFSRGKDSIEYCSDTVYKCSSSPNNNSIIFLGDNVYYKGLPKKNSFLRGEMERRLNTQLDLIKDFNGNKYFIPGNHDWEESGPDGLNRIKEQENYIEEYLGNDKIVMPGNGCPGPFEVHISEDLILVFIDSEWWLRKHKKPIGAENNCEVYNNEDLILQLQDVLLRNNGKHILIAQHHPLFSAGNHGGYYAFKDYLFPLTIIRDRLFIPLPLIGSIYPLMRKYGISRQDMAHPDYHKMITSILGILEKENNIILASAHDHNLQYFRHKELNHIISGSACKTNFVSRSGNADFAHRHKGFSKINYYKNNQAWVEFWEPDGKSGTLIFRYPLYALKTPETARKTEESCKDSLKIIAANPNYKMSPFGEYFLGKHYRRDWTVPVKVNYLDLKCEKGGLIPQRRGGGNQTISIRLIDKDSIQYILRSMTKDPGFLLPKKLRETLADDLMQDQMSTSHPYGPLIVPKLASKIGIYHVKPKLFYVPFSSQLGPYVDEMGGDLAMLEERPDEDMSKFEHMGHSKNIISSRTMYEKIERDNDNQVDQRMYLRSRLFDMLIGDWDRHPDQWRWAEFENGTGITFRPVARDRDVAFALYDGLIPSIIEGSFVAPNLNSFRKNFKDIYGLNLSSSGMDKCILNGLSLKDWIDIADSISNEITDQDIEAAVRELPEESFDASGREIIEKLKSRKKQLRKAAMEFYRLHSKEVEIIGSNKREMINVDRINDDSTRVRIYGWNPKKDKQQLYFDRVFLRNETDEVRIFGLGGKDKISINGKVNKGIRVVIIAGDEEDEIIDSSTVNSIWNKTIIYDSKNEKNNIKGTRSTYIRLASGAWVNEYNSHSLPFFRYNRLEPRISVEYNEDDGIFLGAGIFKMKYDFRKDPKYSHYLVGNFATNTHAFNLRYRGEFFSLFYRDFDLVLRSNITGPNFVLNYFGAGNETDFQEKLISQYRVRMQKYEVTPSVRYRFSENFYMGLGPHYEIMKIIPNKLSEFEETLQKPRYSYIGGKFFTGYKNIDNQVMPTRGIRWNTEFSWYNGTSRSPNTFTNISTDLSFFTTPNFLPFKMVIANRIGGGFNIGNYEYFQSNFLGGRTNLRGFRNTRFAGRSALFSNHELRFELFDYMNYLINAKWGLSIFLDHGRVWTDEETSFKWHYGYGPGIWFNFYDLFVISSTLGFSDEDRDFRLHAGFLF